MGSGLNASSRLKALFAGGALAAALAAGGAASAADAPAKTSAADSQTSVGEVVVTAQFRATQLQKTPLAISAVTAQQIAAMGETNVTDLARTVPNTVISPLGSGWGGTLAAFIRGVGLGDNILSFEPGVPIYVDDVYNGRPQASIFDLLDLDRVEVLRGPQGALFGKNAIGGAVRLISKAPSGSDTGYLEAGYGSFNRFNFRGAYDGALAPNLFWRLSVSDKHADGYFDLLDYVCVHGAGSLGNIQAATHAANCVDGHLGSEGVDSGRLALRWVANDKFEVNLIGDLTIQRQEAPADKYTYIANPQNFPGPLGIDGAVPQLWTNVPQQLYGAGVMYDQRFVTSDPYTSYARYGVNAVDGRDTPNENDLDHWGLEAMTDYDFSPMVHLKTITAYRSWWNTFGRGDASPLGNSETFDDTTHHQFTEEWQLTGTIDRLDYALGAFYYGAFDQNTGFDSLLPVPP
ncbi:MAG TPA: TonB-dependent receptor plug domain-containing protein, partial [Caulobacteraceae bacterium]|nr:TonB-dependent receptor plug domain-containing protein [Caulobacteraceae bacterium]